MRRAFTCAILALPFLVVLTVADAQQSKNKQIKNQMSDEAIEARKECFAEAQARYPGGVPAQRRPPKQSLCCLHRLCPAQGHSPLRRQAQIARLPEQQFPLDFAALVRVTPIDRAREKAFPKGTPEELAAFID